MSDPPKRYNEFLEFGDAEGYRARLGSLRAGLRDGPSDDGAMEPASGQTPS